MKYAFFGTPRFASIVLEQLITAGLSPALVITNPDRPVGRKKIITAPPAKLVAEKAGIPIWQPEKLESASWRIEIDKLGGLDFAVVAAYNKILKKEIIESLPAKFIGVHPSLLPKYRGASPIQSAILNGEKETGVTIYLLDEKVDNGPTLGATKIPLSPETNYLKLEETLARAGGTLLSEILPQYTSGKIQPISQNHAEATFTKKFETADGLVDLEKDAPEVIYHKIKALNPEPGVYTFIEKSGKKTRLKLLDAELVDGRLRLTETQEEGKKPVSNR